MSVGKEGKESKGHQSKMYHLLSFSSSLDGKPSSHSSTGGSRKRSSDSTTQIDKCSKRQNKEGHHGMFFLIYQPSYYSSTIPDPSSFYFSCLMQ